jgi:tetratricopeptide (TPR) repeat protein
VKRILLNASSLAILSIGTGSLVALISQAPAFNTELRRDNVYGQQLLQINRDMYDRSRYLMQQATSFIRADALPFGDAETGLVAAPLDVAEERGVQAVALLEESLTINPGNAHGWATMAWAQLYAGFVDESLDALRASWRLAPYNYSLTLERIDLALILFDPDLADDPTDLNSNDRAALTRDFQVLQSRFRREDFTRYTEDLNDIGITLSLPNI